MPGLVAKGDREARNRMVEANMGLVFRIARGFVGRGLELEDLVGEGNLGLMRAAEEFDPSFGVRFITYAAYWIKESIRRALMNRARTIRLPAHMTRLLVKWRRAEQKLVREKSCAPTFDDVAAALGLTEVQKVLVAKARRASRLQAESSRGGEATCWISEQVVDRKNAVDAMLDLEEAQAVLEAGMRRLDDRERTILRLRYGFDGEALTLTEIGRRLGLTREWVRKIDLRALRKLNKARSEQMSEPLSR